MRARTARVLVALLLCGAGEPLARAGIYTDDLSRCLVESTSKEDRATLVVWMFAAATLHPAVRQMATVSPEQLDEANRKAAQLLMRLLTEACREKTAKAMKLEGAVAIQSAFQVLGQVAGQELFSSAEVGEALSGLQKHLDETKLQAALEDRE